jgi:hypothetical protein
LQGGVYATNTSFLPERKKKNEFLDEKMKQFYVCTNNCSELLLFE